jgi:hypothetical protein
MFVLFGRCLNSEVCRAVSGRKEAQVGEQLRTARDVALSDAGMTFFPICLMLPAALGPGGHSASNRNEYQKQKNNVPGEQSAAGA